MNLFLGGWVKMKNRVYFSLNCHCHYASSIPTCDDDIWVLFACSSIVRLWLGNCVVSWDTRKLRLSEWEIRPRGDHIILVLANSSWPLKPMCKEILEEERDAHQFPRARNGILTYFYNSAVELLTHIYLSQITCKCTQKNSWNYQYTCCANRWRQKNHVALPRMFVYFYAFPKILFWKTQSNTYIFI